MTVRITLADAGRFALAGDSIFTMVRLSRFLQNGDVDPEKRITYRIQRAKNQGEEDEPNRPWFVKVLSGPDNIRDYQYLGTIFPCKFSGGITYKHGRKSRVSEDADSAKGIAWFIRHLDTLLRLKAELADAGLFNRKEIEDSVHKVEMTLNKLRYYHEGRCGACAKRLTVPESIRIGLGPICLEKRGGLGVLDRLAML